MKPLDNLMKEELNDFIAIIKFRIKKNKELFDYDKKEMIEYVIKELSKEFTKEEK